MEIILKNIINLKIWIIAKVRVRAKIRIKIKNKPKTKISADYSYLLLISFLEAIKFVERCIIWFI
jgi:hypothetical protein